MRIVFMGTPDIAATCLTGMLTAGYTPVGVYTQPDRPQGRGMKMTYSPVKTVALEHNIPVFQPENFKAGEAVQQLRDLKPDLIAVVAFGQLLPQSVLDIPRKGCINIHASLLPKYRGSAPYQWAVLNGEKETGVTAMYLVKKMDAGDIIDAVKTPIGENETAGDLLDRLAVMGSDLLVKTLKSIEAGTAKSTPQKEAEVSFAPMLNKDMCPIDFAMTAQQVHDHVRGLHPWPVATAEIAGKHFKIHQTVITDQSTDRPAGTVLGLTKTGLQIACGDGVIEIRSLQAEGGKRMSAPDYFRGHPLEV